MTSTGWIVLSKAQTSRPRKLPLTSIKFCLKSMLRNKLCSTTTSVQSESRARSRTRTLPLRSGPSFRRPLSLQRLTQLTERKLLTMKLFTVNLFHFEYSLISLTIGSKSTALFSLWPTATALNCCDPPNCWTSNELAPRILSYSPYISIYFTSESSSVSFDPSMSVSNSLLTS